MERLSTFTDPEEASTDAYDVIVVGAGILGIQLFALASRRGFRALLLERDDFGEGSTFNSLRILHGGFRYLQQADLPRLYESVRERRWYCQQFPDMVAPLPCVLLLDNRGLRRPVVLRAALAANDVLTAHRNTGVDPEVRLPRGAVLSNAEVSGLFRDVDLVAPKGGARWYDAVMTQSVRVVMEILRSGLSAQCHALNHVEVTGLETRSGRVSGVRATDKRSSREIRFSAPLVINSTGPWAAATAHDFGVSNVPRLPLTLAWNILLSKPPIGACALAFTPRHAEDGRSYLILPRKDSMIVGTGQVSCHEPRLSPLPEDRDMERFVEDINSSIKGIDVDSEDIAHVFAGLVPAREGATADFAIRPWIVDHSSNGGPRGLISAATVKFTTARSVAARVLDKCGMRRKAIATDTDVLTSVAERRSRLELSQRAQDVNSPLTDEDVHAIVQLGEQESAWTAKDVVYRRLGVIDEPARAARIVELINKRALN